MFPKSYPRIEATSPDSLKNKDKFNKAPWSSLPRLFHLWHKAYLLVNANFDFQLIIEFRKLDQQPGEWEQTINKLKEVDDNMWSTGIKYCFWCVLLGIPLTWLYLWTALLFWWPEVCLGAWAYKAAFPQRKHYKNRVDCHMAYSLDYWW